VIKKAKKLLIIIPALWGIIFLVNNASHVSAASFDVQQKRIFLTDNKVAFEVFSNAASVQDFLAEQKIVLGQNDVVFPDKGEKIYANTHVIIWRAKKITVKEGGSVKQFYAVGSTVEQALWENKDINFADDDITNPARQTFVKDGMTIAVTHVLIKEEVRQSDIAYKTISNPDASLNWRVQKVTQPGEKGLREVKYRVVYYDGKEISRKVLENNVVKNPANEIVMQGTDVKTGKIHTGISSWYAQPNHLKVAYPSPTGFYAANYWLPKGTYVKVTNQANGKSLIARINDAGPFVGGRIIDLDKIAFATIASLGAGVIDVKMEEITN
jgi:uncharacterized protein YabE (DUF348 family)